MDNQIQKTENLKELVPKSSKCLINSILKGDKDSVYAIMQTYQAAGIINWESVLSISLHARVPNLTHVYGFQNIHKLLGAMLTGFNESLNLVRPMTAEQVFECSRDLVMTTEEDQLSIEDYVLFFKGAREGKYGKILDRLDQQTIFTMLEEYRDQRHKQFVRIKEEKQIEHKTTGATERSNQPNPIAESMVQLGGRLNDMKEKLREQREINRIQTFKL